MGYAFLSLTHLTKSKGDKTDEENYFYDRIGSSDALWRGLCLRTKSWFWPRSTLLPLVFVSLTGFGFFFGHVVPLSIGSYTHKQSNQLDWCWAITITGSVFGTVVAYILARDYGMILVAVLGIVHLDFDQESEWLPT